MEDMALELDLHSLVATWAIEFLPVSDLKLDAIML
jgi:hypothetical protein